MKIKQLTRKTCASANMFRLRTVYCIATSCPVFYIHSRVIFVVTGSGEVCQLYNNDVGDTAFFTSIAL